MAFALEKERYAAKPDDIGAGRNRVAFSIRAENQALASERRHASNGKEPITWFEQSVVVNEYSISTIKRVTVSRSEARDFHALVRDQFVYISEVIGVVLDFRHGARERIDQNPLDDSFHVISPFAGG